MPTNYALSKAEDRRPQRVSPALVAEYKRAHEEMLEAIGALDELLCEIAPNQLRLSHTRLRITRKSYACRSLFDKIVSVLELSNPMLGRKIETLKELHAELRKTTELHLARWTHEQARIDPNGYCLSSAELRQLWRTAIDHERRLLYPFL